MFGVVNGLVLFENERMDLINQRILERLPTKPVDYVFSPRPVSTRYMLLPVVDPPAVLDPPIQQKAAAPFMQNVDDESTLLNIQFAMQDNCVLAYAPSSTSDLYKVKIPSTTTVQTHPLLFSESIHAETPRHPTAQPFNNVRLRKILS